MSIRRETRHEDYDRTHSLMAALGGSLLPPDQDTPPDRAQFERVVANALYVNRSAEPPAGHTYPKRG
ncbi:hypothetical protein [Streptomyces anandii]|uniref:hypothetical protein n=1 Tax=Streptomyces anandii TaxID=285454 RepID=UPI00110F73DA|nr:hypothetical protein [Streptomyces anandii]GGY18059.1 hypothetical protein GCM10010510_72320 [Streptomyces anandii JCM 4720]